MCVTVLLYIKKFDNQSKFILHQTTEQVNTKRMKNEQK